MKHNRMNRRQTFYYSLQINVPIKTKCGKRKGNNNSTSLHAAKSTYLRRKTTAMQT